MFLLIFKFSEHVNGKMCYRLPYDQVPKFGHFFNELEAMRVQLEIDEFGISDSTMEDIFIKMANLADSKAEDNKQAQPNDACKSKG